MAVARSSSGRVTKSKEEGHFGSFLPIDALYSIAFGTNMKTAEPIEMSFRTMSGLVPTNCVLCGGDDLQRGRGNFGENVPNTFNTFMNCKLDWSVQRRARDRSRRMIASVGRVYYQPPTNGIDCNCTPWSNSDIYDCLVWVRECEVIISKMLCSVRQGTWASACSQQ